MNLIVCTVAMSVTNSTWKQCFVRLYLQLFMFYLSYFCLLAHSGVQQILCCFVCVLYAQCCEFLLLLEGNELDCVYCSGSLEWVRINIWLPPLIRVASVIEALTSGFSCCFISMLFLCTNTLQIENIDSQSLI
jgi:hypothetical protein